MTLSSITSTKGTSIKRDNPEQGSNCSQYIYIYIYIHTQLYIHACVSSNALRLFAAFLAILYERRAQRHGKETRRNGSSREQHTQTYRKQDRYHHTTCTRGICEWHMQHMRAKPHVEIEIGGHITAQVAHFEYDTKLNSLRPIEVCNTIHV